MHTLKAKCAYCGAVYDVAEVSDEIFDRFAEVWAPFVPSPAPCSCPGAVAEREEREAEERVREEARRREELRASYDLIGIPAIYRRAELDADQEDMLEKVKRGRGLFLTGDPGVGKTHAACAILRRLHDEGWPRLKFCDIARVDREVRASWDEFGNNEDRVIRSYVKATCLVIDDLGCEAISPTVMRIIQAIISERDACGAPTVITSNYDRQGFAELIASSTDAMKAARLASRIKGMTDMVRLEGPDRRLER